MAAAISDAQRLVVGEDGVCLSGQAGRGGLSGRSVKVAVPIG